MFRGALTRLRARLGRDGADETDADETDGSRFVPSPLDASVRYAHGGSDAEIDREMARIEDAARRLEERRDE